MLRLVSNRMCDAQLAEWLCLPADEAAKIIPNLTPEQRATYERMAQRETAVALWQKGLGPLPSDVLVTRR